jgi:hypothetical protein
MDKAASILNLILIVVISLLIFYLIELFVGNYLTSVHFENSTQNGSVLRENIWVGVFLLIGRQYLVLSTILTLLFYFLPSKSRSKISSIIKWIIVFGITILLFYGVYKAVFFFIGGEGKAAALEFIITWFFRIMAILTGYKIGTNLRENRRTIIAK